MQTNVIIKFTYQGIHKWPDVSVPAVNYLMHPHRHLFNITCLKPVTHNNRQVEILTFRDEVIAHLDKKYNGNFVNMSCEDIAEHLLHKFQLYSCTVLEDGENGAVVSRDAQDEL